MPFWDFGWPLSTQLNGHLPQKRDNRTVRLTHQALQHTAQDRLCAHKALELRNALDVEECLAIWPGGKAVRL